MGVTSGSTNLGKILGLNNVAIDNNSLEYDNHNHRGVNVGVNITSISGTMPVLTVFIEGQDPASGVWYPLVASVAITKAGFSRLIVYPGITPVANMAASDVLPSTWRIRYTVGGVSPVIMATIGACLLK